MPLAVDIGNSFQQFFNQLIGFLDNIFGFLILLLIGYIVAKIARTALNKILDRVGVDRRLHESPVGTYIEGISPGSRPSHLLGAIAFYVIFLFFLTQALQALRLPALNVFINQVLAFLPRIGVAILILVVAAAIAGGIAGAVAKTMGDTPTGKLVGTVAPTLVMAIAVFMILDQLQIAPVIVTITYAALLGFLALAGALAFGLGGQGVAAKLVQDSYNKSQDAIDQGKRDAQLGKERGQQQAQQAQQRVQSGGSGASSPGTM